jgi:hypothetical protein
MAQKFWISKTLYDELNKEAADKHLTLEAYLDQLLEAIICANWKAPEIREG